MHLWKSQGSAHTDRKWWVSPWENHPLTKVSPLPAHWDLLWGRASRVWTRRTAPQQDFKLQPHSAGIAPSCPDQAWHGSYWPRPTPPGLTRLTVPDVFWCACLSFTTVGQMQMIYTKHSSDLLVPFSWGYSEKFIVTSINSYVADRLFVKSLGLKVTNPVTSTDRLKIKIFSNKL